MIGAFGAPRKTTRGFARVIVKGPCQGNFWPLWLQRLGFKVYNLVLGFTVSVVGLGFQRQTSEGLGFRAS